MSAQFSALAGPSRRTRALSTLAHAVCLRVPTFYVQVPQELHEDMFQMMVFTSCSVSVFILFMCQEWTKQTISMDSGRGVRTQFPVHEMSVHASEHAVCSGTEWCPLHAVCSAVIAICTDSGHDGLLDFRCRNVAFPVNESRKGGKARERDF